MALTFDNGVTLLTPDDALPDLPDSVDDLYLDFETSSGDVRLDSLNPWHHCSPCGLGITWDDMPHAWYIPCEHPRWREWARDVMRRSDRWVNHNVKYDAHVWQRSVGPLPAHVGLVDTVVLAKLVDSDMAYRGGYGLDVLSEQWLSEDISGYEEALKPYLHCNKDYGRIPHDVIAEYGGQDVLTNRRLYRYLESQLPAECKAVWDTERELTRVLLDMETHGVRVDPRSLKIAELRLLTRSIALQEKIARVVGRPIRPHVNEDCYEVLCVQYGLPVVAWTNPDDDDKVSNPSFDKHALANYLVLPGAPVELVRDMLACRQIETLMNNFVVPYQELHVDGIMHMSFNQCVRTGRLSCSKPNMQQLDKNAKKLILPREGNGFLSADASQIEFRTIVHYIQDQRLIAEYAANPDVDYHEWVAGMCGIKRRPAKTVNFSMAFGQGKERTIKALSVNEDIVTDIQSKVEAMIAGGEIDESKSKNVFDVMARRRGEMVYDTYHDTLPGVRRTARRATAVAKSRGYVRNIAGRRRRLPKDRAHIAFNTLNQSSAADIVKAAMVELARELRGTPLQMVVNVHDEILIEGPVDAVSDPDVMRGVVAVLERDRFGLSVPTRWHAAHVATSWGDLPDQVPVSTDGVKMDLRERITLASAKSRVISPCPTRT